MVDPVGRFRDVTATRYPTAVTEIASAGSIGGSEISITQRVICRACGDTDNNPDGLTDELQALRMPCRPDIAARRAAEHNLARHEGMSADQPPGTGLWGRYEGGCITCLRPTGTALAFLGSPEWLVSGLISLGVPQDEAPAAIIRILDRRSATPPAGECEAIVPVCDSCVSGSPFPAPVLDAPGAAIPRVVQVYTPDKR
jgi:hypothetical protein